MGVTGGVVVVGDDGGYVRIHAPHLDSGLRRKDGRRPVGDDGGWVRFHALPLGPGLRRGEVARSGLRRGPRSGSGMTDVWGPNPWVAAFTGTTMRGAPSLHQGEALAGFLSAGA